MNDLNYRQILGVRFFAGSPAEAVTLGLKGGLVVMPAAPAGLLAASGLMYLLVRYAWPSELE